MLTPNQMKAIEALMTHPTKKDAAKAAGISDVTLRKYLSNEEFQEEYRKAFTGLVTEATRQAQKALSPALSALSDIVKDKDESSTARIAAARSLLEYGLRLTEFSDILREMDEGGG